MNHIRSSVKTSGILRSLSTLSPEFRVWNRITKAIVPLSSHRQEVLTWYACGPTVYNSAHIGHASSYIRQDVLRRILEGLNGNVSIIQLMGITDIDDKIIKRANEMNVSCEQISLEYELEFFKDLDNLGVKPPTIKSRVTNFIPQIILFVQKLIEKENAYVAPDGSVYFDVEKYGRYGKLRRLDEEKEEEEEVGQGKKNRRDFAVWKGAKPGEPFWTAPWGKGRPGWHIECSVMASHYFGTKLDIHTGGHDLAFPHHENEEAQCCARFEVDDWVSHWLHFGQLHIPGDAKMSKSLGNTIKIGDFLQDNSAKAFRMFCMLSKYSHGLEYSPASFNHAISMLNKLESFISDGEAILKGDRVVRQSINEDVWSHFINSKDQINNFLRHDFDTSAAIQHISVFIDYFNHAFVTELNSSVAESSVDFSFVLASSQLVRGFLELVGILGNKTGETQNDMKMQDILTECIEFREQVRYHALAFDEEDKATQKLKRQERKTLLENCDEMRKRLQPMGIEIKDHGKSSSWALKS